MIAPDSEWVVTPQAEVGAGFGTLDPSPPPPEGVRLDTVRRCALELGDIATREGG